MANTTIPGRQIADSAITNVKVAAGAGIETSKLADGATFIRSGGSVAFIGNQSMGNNKLTNVATATNNDEAVNLGQMNSAIAAVNSMFDNKASARAATTANITISNPGTAVFDGVTLVNGDRLLVKSQTLPAENGIYIFNGAGVALTRATDLDAWTEIPGALLAVEEGTVNADTLWLNTSDQGGTLGTTAVTWFALPMTAGTGGLASANFVDKEIPSGAINGSNTAYTLANTPTAGTEHVFVNGILQESGAGNDYTISGATITMLSALATGEKIRVTYRKA